MPRNQGFFHSYFVFNSGGMENLRLFTAILFVLTTALAIAGFRRAFAKPSAALWIILIWTLVQGLLGLTGFYLHPGSFPPTILLLLLPPVLIMIILFTTTSGRRFMDLLNP